MIYKNKKELIERMVHKDDIVLDIGFTGQGVPFGNENWPHGIIKSRAQETFGMDLELDERLFPDQKHYFKQNAESFELSVPLSVIFAGDVIEHFSNPGLFLDSCAKSLISGGRLIITTPNAFNLFSISEKIMKKEPTVNKEHTCYFNSRTLSQLLVRHGYEIQEVSFMYNLDALHKESIKKKALNVLYKFLSFWTDKYLETLVIVAVPKKIN